MGKRGLDETVIEGPLKKRVPLPIQRLGAAVPVMLNPLELSQLAVAIRTEMNAGLTGWGGDQTLIARYENPVSDDNKRAVRAQGEKHGCHTCLTRIEVDHTQPWVGDHIPPTKLSEKFKDMLRERYPNMPKGTILYPQCDSCASQQSTLVKAIKAEKSDKWAARIKALAGTNDEKLLTGGHPPAGYSISATAAKVSPGQSQDIQVLGRKNGCHSCGAKLPALNYHADHCPPVVMHMPGTEAVCGRLEIKLPAFAAKPQCPKCSHEQGGRLSRIKKALSDAADTFKLTNYWNS